LKASTPFQGTSPPTQDAKSITAIRLAPVSSSGRALWSVWATLKMPASAPGRFTRSVLSSGVSTIASSQGADLLHRLGRVQWVLQRFVQIGNLAPIELGDIAWSMGCGFGGSKDAAYLIELAAVVRVQL
jgi:hypothetical protein